MTGRYACIPGWALGLGLSKNDWIVLVVICLHADRDGRAFPSIRTIAAEAHIAPSNVPRSLAKLETLGLIRRERVPRSIGGWQNNVYQVVFDAPDASTNRTETDDPTRVITGGRTAQRVVISDSTETQGAIRGENAPMASPLKRDVIRSNALTDHSTDPYQGEGPTGGSGRVDAHEQVGTRSCKFYVTNDHGYRLCGRPCLEGHTSCAEHVRPTPTARNIGAR